MMIDLTNQTFAESAAITAEIDRSIPLTRYYHSI